MDTVSARNILPTSHSPRHKCWKREREDMLVILIIATLVHRDIWQGRVLGEDSTTLWRVELDLLFLYVEIIAVSYWQYHHTPHTIGLADNQYLPFVIHYYYNKGLSSEDERQMTLLRGIITCLSHIEYTEGSYHEWEPVIPACWCWLHNITAKCPVLTCDIAWDLSINIKRNQPKLSYKTLLDSKDILNFYHKTSQSPSERNLVFLTILRH